MKTVSATFALLAIALLWDSPKDATLSTPATDGITAGILQELSRGECLQNWKVEYIAEKKDLSLEEKNGIYERDLHNCQRLGINVN